MNAKLFLRISLIGALLFTIACAPVRDNTAPKQVSIEVSSDDFMKDRHVSREAEVAQGGILTVLLSSNPSTGFLWTEQAQIGDATTLQQTGHRFLPPQHSNGTPLVGAAGREEWTFKALKSGATSVSMDYSRPWAGGEKGVWTFNLSVKIRPGATVDMQVAPYLTLPAR